jgi:hypothetical protein
MYPALTTNIHIKYKIKLRKGCVDMKESDQKLLDMFQDQISKKDGSITALRRQNEAQVIYIKELKKYKPITKISLILLLISIVFNVYHLLL